MDELEISGKRYISTKRAGKDHKYHADYIGQLIRAKKVEGQKVGRSWYVDADSLAAYLGTEIKNKADAPSAPIHAVSEPIARVITVEEPAEKSAEFVENTTEPIIEAEEGTSYIPVKITQTSAVENIEEKREASAPVFYRTAKEEREARGLRYIADEGPLLPRIQKIHTHTAMPRQNSSASVWPPKPHPMPVQRDVPKLQPLHTMYVQEERPLATDAPVTKKTISKKTSRATLLARQAGVVLALGAIVFLVAAALSTHLLLTQTIDGGQGANVTYSVK